MATGGRLRHIGVRRLFSVSLVFVACSAASLVAAEPLTADQVVARCAEALGGGARISALRTLRFKVTYPDKQELFITEIKRPNRVRSEADFILVFDGKRAGYLKGAPSRDGADPGPQLVGAEEWRDFELDIAFLFPAFFDYPPEYLGLEATGGKQFHRLGVTLPMGIRATYFLDAETFRPSRIVADILYHGVVYHPERVVENYRETDGLLFPRNFASIDWGPKGRASVVSIEVNVPLRDDRFEMPAGF